MIERARIRPDERPPLIRVVVGVDPSGSDGSSGDAQGIVAVGLARDGRAYVLDDGSVRESPSGWAGQVRALCARWEADRVVAEVNFGGAMVEAVLRAAGVTTPFRLVTASRNKVVRAEPVAALYEQGKVSHAGAFPELEDQLCAMTSGGFTGLGSPDRLDALVWALTELCLGPGAAGASDLIW